MLNENEKKVVHDLAIALALEDFHKHDKNDIHYLVSSYRQRRDDIKKVVEEQAAEYGHL